MKNIDRFNLYTAHIFAKLYEDFPIARVIDEPDIVRAVALQKEQGESETDQNNLVRHSINWLEKTGYLRLMQDNPDAPKRYTLSPKAFEALAANTPDELRETSTSETHTAGEALMNWVKQAGSDIATEARTQFATQFVAFIIGWIFSK